MTTIPAVDAADSPADYLDQLYLELPRLFPRGGSEDDVVTLFAAVGVDLADPEPEVRFGDWSRLLFVPAAEPGTWQRWNPAHGPAPKPRDGHLLVTLVLLLAGSTEATNRQMREVFGNDKSLRRPLYQSAMQLAPASPAESAHLVGTLRSLLATDEES